MLTAFIVCLAVLVTSFIMAIVNMARMGRSAVNLDTDSFGSGFAVHLGAMVGIFLGGLGASIFGIVLLVQKFTS